ncbi:hypothetical protein JQ612_18385 [Bradyrhizobium manausense]|uniref:hypothetical protein n=1 Tax=Bradyrhizobium manausense TaxID=989370 RepID=UPI001BA605CF|nr:hypothetical protein [Bradyrhizobium manausense]MBR0725428.1 hypothetical protein [Bradyrhizobium manausense]MBR0835158.1 hypothetical protein [Bradyrhizobium manausense]
MTNEAIKALMVLALYGVLEITLFWSSIGRLARRTALSGNRRMIDGELKTRPAGE